MDKHLFDGLQQLGDDALILGQRLCEWSGHAATVEIDISLSNLALDMVGQATLLLDHAGTVEGAGRDADRLAFHRDAHEFRNCLLVEQPNGDFARTMMRHFLFSHYALPLYEGLQSSSDEQLSAIAQKAVKELRYHAEYSADWVIRMGDGNEESRQRSLDALEWSWRFVGDMFDEGESWSDLASRGVVPSRASIRPLFDASVAQTFAAAKLPVPEEGRPVIGGRSGKHSEHLSLMLAEMQILPRTHPEAVW